jgi:RimJ/RimL family protein N-acetyltransferase
MMANKLLCNTERLLLRSIKPEDARAVFNYRSDAIANQYQGWIPKTVEEATDFILNRTSAKIDVYNSWHQLVIILKENYELIGDIGLHFLDKESKQVEIGCTINKEYQGKGYACEALSETINYLFVELNKRRIVTSIDPRNLPSIALVERLGFIKEAHFKESILINGEWVDDVVYAMLNPKR